MIEAPGAVKSFEFEKSVKESIEIIKKWFPHRIWLVANKVKFAHFSEEIEY